MIRRMGLVAAIAALAAVPAVADGANTRDSVTGGGQAFFNGRDMTGAGDTIAFQAQRSRYATEENPELATGQIQVNRRAGSGADEGQADEGPVKFHGTITCMNVSGDPDESRGYAYMSGYSRATKTQPAQPFELYVSDGGGGQLERNDMIMLFVGDETANNDSDNEDANDVCGFSDFNASGSPELARGNVQVRNRNDSEDDDPSAGTEATATGQSLSAAANSLLP